MTQNSDSIDVGAINDRMGRVYLVGAGPGHSGYLTMMGYEACRNADVILYDRLAIPVLEKLDLNEKTILMDVGKAPAPLVPAENDKIVRCKSAHRGVGQEAINEALLRQAAAGKTVVRLKGGDPLIFGRGGEEAAYLRAAGISVEVIPGVSAFQAAAMALDVSLTHRHVSSALQLITGHRLKTDDAKSRRYWQAQADSLHDGVTLAFYMGMGSHERLVDILLKSGCPGWMPAAVVSNASLPGQKVVRSRLTNLIARIKHQDLQAPAIILIGKVLLHSWEMTPCAGRSDEPLILGNDASAYYEGDDLDVGKEKGAGMLLVGDVVANASIFRTGVRPAEIDLLRLGGVASVVALRESLDAADLTAGALDRIAIETSDTATRDALRRNLGLASVPPSGSALPDGVIEMELSHGGARRSFPAISIVPHPERIQQARNLLMSSPEKPVAICDEHTAVIVAPILLESGGDGRPIHVRDAATMKVLNACGFQAQTAYKLKSIYPGEPMSCPTK